MDRPRRVYRQLVPTLRLVSFSALLWACRPYAEAAAKPIPQGTLKLHTEGAGWVWDANANAFTTRLRVTFALSDRRDRFTLAEDGTVFLLSSNASVSPNPVVVRGLTSVGQSDPVEVRLTSPGQPALITAHHPEMTATTLELKPPCSDGPVELFLWAEDPMLRFSNGAYAAQVLIGAHWKCHPMLMTRGGSFPVQLACSNGLVEPREVDLGTNAPGFLARRVRVTTQSTSGPVVLKVFHPRLAEKAVTLPVASRLPAGRLRLRPESPAPRWNGTAYVQRVWVALDFGAGADGAGLPASERVDLVASNGAVSAASVELSAGSHPPFTAWVELAVPRAGTAGWLKAAHREWGEAALEVAAPAAPARLVAQPLVPFLYSGRFSAAPVAVWLEAEDGSPIPAAEDRLVALEPGPLRAADGGTNAWVLTHGHSSTVVTLDHPDWWRSPGWSTIKATFHSPGLAPATVTLAVKTPVALLVAALCGGVGGGLLRYFTRKSAVNVALAGVRMKTLRWTALPASGNRRDAAGDPKPWCPSLRRCAIEGVVTASVATLALSLGVNFFGSTGVTAALLGSLRGALLLGLLAGYPGAALFGRLGPKASAAPQRNPQPPAGPPAGE